MAHFLLAGWRSTSRLPNEAEAIWFEREYEEREVLEVVKAMNGEKVPSSDGFSIAFFQA